MIRPLADRILVALKPEPKEVVSEAGLVLVRDPDKIRTAVQGIVVALGVKSNTCDLDEVRSEVHTWCLEHIDDYLNAWYGNTDSATIGMTIPSISIRDGIDRILMRMKPAPFDVHVGDCVLFTRWSGVDAFDEDGVSYTFVREHEIIGVVPPVSVTTQPQPQEVAIAHV